MFDSLKRAQNAERKRVSKALRELKQAGSHNPTLDEILARFMASSINNTQAVIEASLEDDEKRRDELTKPLRDSKREAKQSIQALIAEEVAKARLNDYKEERISELRKERDDNIYDERFR